MRKRLVLLILAIVLGLLVFAIAYPMVASGGALAGY